MGTAKDPDVVKAFAALLYRDDQDLQKACKALERKFGPVDYRYGPVDFTHSRYYQKEMGRGLKKLYVTFDQYILPERLHVAKTYTNRLERKFTNDGARRINIDPGYVTRENLILFSTKNFFHRIYVGKGVYAEVTLHFRRGRFRYFSWTYPDYREPEFGKFLNKPRAQLVKQLRSLAEET